MKKITFNCASDFKKYVSSLRYIDWIFLSLGNFFAMIRLINDTVSDRDSDVWIGCEISDTEENIENLKVWIDDFNFSNNNKLQENIEEKASYIDKFRDIAKINTVGVLDSSFITPLITLESIDKSFVAYSAGGVHAGYGKTPEEAICDLRKKVNDFNKSE
jgi:hypothetical protein